MKSLTAQFKDWVATKPADETFDPWDCHGCAGYQFLRDMGAAVERCSITNWRDRDGGYHKLPKVVGDAIDWACVELRPVTFGALHARLTASRQQERVL